MSQKQFDLLVGLYRRVEFVEEREGKLTIEDDATLGALKAVAADQGEYGVHLPDSDIDTVTVGETISVEMAAPRVGIGVFAPSFGDLIRPPSARIAEPARYYLISECYNRCDDVPAPEIVNRYRKLLELIKLLGEAAAYVDNAKAHLVYIHEGKFDVPVQYSGEDVEALDTAAVDGLVASLRSDTHREQRLAILAEAVRELTQSTSLQGRFQMLLAHLPDLTKRFNDGYRLFASSFSYEKVKDELEVARMEYAAKIHKVFADIQNQVLGIPVATVIVATQMKVADKVDANFYTNVAILIGAWIFVTLVAALLINQNHTLDVLATEIKRQRKELEKLHKEIADSFSDVFGFLNHRLLVQRYLLNGVLGIVLIGGLVTTVFFFVLTSPAKDALTSFIGH